MYFVEFLIFMLFYLPCFQLSMIRKLQEAANCSTSSGTQSQDSDSASIDSQCGSLCELSVELS